MRYGIGYGKTAQQLVVVKAYVEIGLTVLFVVASPVDKAYIQTLMRDWPKEHRDLVTFWVSSDHEAAIPATPKAVWLEENAQLTPEQWEALQERRLSRQSAQTPSDAERNS